MTWFIFAGDMLVMLFMVGLIIWVFMVAPDKEIDDTANIPLQDEVYGSDLDEGVSPTESGDESHG